MENSSTTYSREHTLKMHYFLGFFKLNIFICLFVWLVWGSGEYVDVQKQFSGQPNYIPLLSQTDLLQV